MSFEAEPTESTERIINLRFPTDIQSDLEMVAQRTGKVVEALILEGTIEVVDSYLNLHN